MQFGMQLFISYIFFKGILATNYGYNNCDKSSDANTYFFKQRLRALIILIAYGLLIVLFYAPIIKKASLISRYFCIVSKTSLKFLEIVRSYSCFLHGNKRRLQSQAR